jgi:D-arabinose 1-dehydrogenase-like Zn-dependent alcohol dehydrogenase
MRAIVIRDPGGVDKLELTEWPSVEPGAGQVRVRVAGCGVCHRDLLDREGSYPFMRRPIVTGHEFAGEIVTLGPGVTAFALGDRVATTHRPACGECQACRADDETRCLGSLASYVPEAVVLDEAGFLHCTAGVALRALRSRARLQAGETVVISGASGGVGVHAIQVAKILGARVIAVTSNEAKVEALYRIGADQVVVGGSDFHKQLGAIADVALELVGEPTLNASQRSLRIGGRVVLVGNVTAGRAEINPGLLIMREISLHGSASASRSDLAEVLSWAAAGRLRPVVAGKVSLSQARAAQTRLAEKGVVGRLVLIP